MALFKKKKPATTRPTDNDRGDDDVDAGTNESHFLPQEETDPPARPEAVDPSHLLPQEEVEEEPRRVKVVDPSHLKPQGRVKKIGLCFLFCLAIVASANAQTATLYNALGTNLATDTVTNTATGYVQIKTTSPLGPKLCNSTTFVIVLTEISGTTAGTVTLMGSIDGTNYKALTTNDTQTAITTVTATDVASQVFTWRLVGSPYPFYRVSWTGTGTMSATVAAKLFRN